VPERHDSTPMRSSVTMRRIYCIVKCTLSAIGLASDVNTVNLSAKIRPTGQHPKSSNSTGTSSRICSELTRIGIPCSRTFCSAIFAGEATAIKINGTKTHSQPTNKAAPS
jgi:hypothetical protein